MSNRQKKKETIYAVPNPMWLSDTFVFRKHEDEEIGTAYVSINYRNEIEEIGIDISRRMHNRPLEMILSGKSCKEATKVQKMRLNCIGDEYWYHVLRDPRRKY